MVNAATPLLPVSRYGRDAGDGGKPAHYIFQIRETAHLKRYVYERLPRADIARGECAHLRVYRIEHGANNAVKALAKALSVGVEKKLIAAALTKGTLYPILKSTLKWFGVKLTKEIFAKTVKNAIPVVGGIVGGGITFLSFKPCCMRLKDVLTDTMLSNPAHISSAEEEHVFSHIVDGAYEAEYEECEESHSI